MPVNGESKQWLERPAIFKSKLQLILVFVKHSPGVWVGHRTLLGLQMTYLIGYVGPGC